MLRLVVASTTLPDTVPAAVIFPPAPAAVLSTARLPLNVSDPSVAKGVHVNGNAVSAWPAAQAFGVMLNVPLVVIGLGEAVSPAPALMLVTVPLPLPPGNVCPGAKVTKPSNFAVPLTSNVAPGVGVPMPTLVLAVAPFTPAMLPSTRALLAPTAALAPMAVALFTTLEVLSPAWEPTKVLLEPVMFGFPVEQNVPTAPAQ